MSDRLSPEPVTRRDFLGLAGLLASAAALAGAALGALRLPRPKVLPDRGSRFRIGIPDEFPPGTEKSIPGRRVLVISKAEGLAAVSLVCTHLGCVVSPVSEGYLCRCHGSRFAADGGVEQGPAPRPLRWLKVSLAPNGFLMVEEETEVAPGTFFKVGSGPRSHGAG